MKKQQDLQLYSLRVDSLLAGEVPPTAPEGGEPTGDTTDEDGDTTDEDGDTTDEDGDGDGSGDGRRELTLAFFLMTYHPSKYLNIKSHN